jgi:hypothetical protein
MEIAIIEHLVLLVLTRFQNYKFFAELDEDTICFFIYVKDRLSRRNKGGNEPFWSAVMFNP